MCGRYYRTADKQAIAEQFATLAVERVEAVEDGDEEGGRHDEGCGDVVGLNALHRLLHGVEGGAHEHSCGQLDGAVEEAEDDERGDYDGRHVDGAVLP